MQESTIPLIAAITILCVITLIFFVNEFFRKYKVVKKRKPRKMKRVQKLNPNIEVTEESKNVAIEFARWNDIYGDESKLYISNFNEFIKQQNNTKQK